MKIKAGQNKAIFLILFLCCAKWTYGQFGPQNTLTISTMEPREVIAGDLTGDGYKDIVAISFGNGELMWFYNIGGQGSFTSKQTINQSNTEGSSVDLADLDNDGDLDILAGYGVDGNEVAWYENVNGFAAFGPKQVIGVANTVRKVRAADIDNDGDLDVFAAAQFDDELIMYKNLDGQGNFSEKIVLASGSEMDGVNELVLADIDGDNDLDIACVTAFSYHVMWQENTDGQGSFGPVQILTDQAIIGNGIDAADLDGDGDIDLVATSGLNDGLMWFENLNGLGDFSEPIFLGTTPDEYPNCVKAGDIDLDGDMDLIYSAFSGGYFSYTNQNGLGNFVNPSLISDIAIGATRVSFADLDNDGDLDVMSVSRNDNKVAWYENLIDIPLTFSAELTPVLCFGEMTGAIQVNITGGTAPYTYNWNPSTVFGENPTGLSAGIYGLTVTDAVGESLIEVIELTEPEEPLLVTISTTPITNMGGDGTATATVTGGTTPYTFEWNTTPVQTTDSISNLPAGTYTVTVTDANDCTSVKSVLVALMSSLTPSDKLLSFDLSPNPATNMIHINIDFPQVENWTLSLTNTLGQRINSQRGRGNLKKEMNIELLSAGMYYFTLTLQNGERWVKPLVVF